MREISTLTATHTQDETVSSVSTPAPRSVRPRLAHAFLRGLCARAISSLAARRGSRGRLVSRCRCRRNTTARAPSARVSRSLTPRAPPSPTGTPAGDADTVADTTFDISRMCVVMCTAPYSCSLESLVLSVSSHGDGRKNICSMETCSEHAMVYTHMDDGHAGAQADFVFRVKAVKPPAATHHTQTDRWRRASPSARAPSSVGGPATRRAA